MLAVGSDVGGTFTDIAAADLSTGRISIGKVLTSPADPAVSVLAGMDELIARNEATHADVNHVVHGTTLAANMIIERRGAPTALITNEGFIDCLETGVENRYDMFDLMLQRPAPLVLRRRRYGVTARVDADGSVSTPLDPAEVEAIAAAIRTAGIDAVAVCLLHSYRNPEPERQIGAILERLLPGVPITLSCEIAPEIREYPRASTAVANAYVMPLIGHYLTGLQKKLADRGFQRRLFIMLSEGGMAPVETAAAAPVRLIESGPAAGVNAAALVARRVGADRALAFDMGGTTAKLSVVRDGEPRRVYRAEVARQKRFRAGSGLELIVPTIDLIEIGAGGGSIAAVGHHGLLTVGPRSAGARPGPACYGQGGIEATVTDADVVAGFLDPSNFLGGGMRLDVDGARAAIGSRVADPLGLSLLEGAAAIQQVVDENMAQAARIHAVEHGLDARDFTLVAFGGAGPVHAWRVAQILKIRRFIVPMGAGVMSAAGMLVTPPSIEIARSHAGLLDLLDPAAIADLTGELKERVDGVLSLAGAVAGSITYGVLVECRYVGQTHELQIPLLVGPGEPVSPQEIADLFEERYRSLYGRTLPNGRIEAITWRVRGQTPAFASSLTFEAETGDRSPFKGRREAFFGGYGAIDVDVADRYALKQGDRVPGPCLIEERETTTVVGPGASVSVDTDLNLIVDMG